mmetsp:Transcript_92179/g.192727  ORF Transcript_92179/g.192727 Transcript_92179/m.192727 type:complete len:203 (-) Transcript_92179:849-1457(-)
MLLRVVADVPQSRGPFPRAIPHSPGGQAACGREIRMVSLFSYLFFLFGTFDVAWGAASNVIGLSRTPLTFVAHHAFVAEAGVHGLVVRVPQRGAANRRSLCMLSRIIHRCVLGRRTRGYLTNIRRLTCGRGNRDIVLLQAGWHTRNVSGVRAENHVKTLVHSSLHFISIDVVSVVAERIFKLRSDAEERPKDEDHEEAEEAG